MGTLAEWLNALFSGAVFCTLFVLFGGASDNSWCGSSGTVMARIGALFFSSLQFGLSNSFGRRALLGGLLWISLANMIGFGVSGIAFRAYAVAKRLKSG